MSGTRTARGPPLRSRATHPVWCCRRTATGPQALVCALALVINAVNLAAAVASRADTYAPGPP